MALIELRCAALEVHVRPDKWPMLLERLEGRVSAELLDQLRGLEQVQGAYRPTIYGPMIDEFLEALPPKGLERRRIKALRPKRVVGEPA